MSHMWKWKLCSTLSNPTDYTVHGILQARILEWVAFPFSKGSSQPRDRTQVSSIAVDSLPAEPQRSPRIPEWVAYPCSRGSSRSRNQTGVSYFAGGFFANWATRKHNTYTACSLSTSFIPHILIWLICWFTYSFIQQLYIWQFGFSGNPK